MVKEKNLATFQPPGSFVPGDGVALGLPRLEHAKRAEHPNTGISRGLRAALNTAKTKGLGGGSRRKGGQR